MGAGSITAGSPRSKGMGICLARRRRVGLLLRRVGDAIVRRAGGSHQRDKLDEGVDRYEDGTVDNAAHATRSVIQTGMAAVR